MFFHLDPLWAHPAIDAVGIDNYMPLSDWRDADLDSANAGRVPALRRRRGHGRGNIAAGEGFDWYYASDADRGGARPHADHRRAGGQALGLSLQGYRRLVGQSRTSTGSAASRTAEPDRLGAGDEADLVHRARLPAVDKGPNQPNVFVDPKSAESALPYFSSGGRSDDLAQRAGC